MLGWGREPVVEVVDADGSATRAPLPDDGEAIVGPLFVCCLPDGDGRRMSWLIEATRHCRIHSVRLWVRRPRAEAAAWFRHGWQSWSPFGVDVVGQADDPVRVDTPELVRALYDGDPLVPPPGELRSWGVAGLVADLDGLGAGGGGSAAGAGAGRLDAAAVADRPGSVIGFVGGDRHDGLVRIRTDGHWVAVAADAFLGGAVLERGERRMLHDVVVWDGGSLGRGLAAWAELLAAGRVPARPRQPRSGWCSWYQYFHRVTEDDVRANLARAGADGWAFDVFQVDDGHQSAIGDWLTPAPAFPTADGLAAEIAGAGYVPGLWLAPFLAVPHSRVATEHPEWVLADPAGPGRYLANVNLEWGGEVWALDTSRDDVVDHLEAVTAELVGRGWRYLKLDFLYAAALPGRAHDPRLTPAERFRRGLAAVRRGAGDDVTLLGCGSPLVPAIGLVDAMRIGPDVAPRWGPDPDGLVFAGYEQCPPALSNALDAVAHRSFLANRWWVDDPDCLLLREEDTELTPAQVDAWVERVVATGGAVFVSDDLSRLDERHRARFDAAVSAARTSGAGKRP